MRFYTARALLVCLLTFSVAPLAHAQFAVIDIHAVAQLLAQVHMLEQQLVTARDHLAQAQSEFQSMTGSRGMERLLSGTARNYLPADWAELDKLRHRANTTYGALGSELQSAVDGMAVLSAQQLAALSPAARSQLNATRTSAAMLQVLTHQALATTSGRFASLQQLINAIRGAGDQKAILDLQARIGAEQGMLQNEQTKLQVLYQAAEAEQWANQQRARERVIAGHGQFAARFQPVPVP